MNTAVIVIIFSVVLLYIIFKICLAGILKKEKYNPILALIPFYGIYLYFKLCKLPFWTFFVPFVNVIVLVCTPYRVAKQYGMNRTHQKLAILLPFIYLPYIAFSNLQNVEKIYDNTFIKNKFDLDLLEQRLENENNKNDVLIDVDNANKQSLISSQKNNVENSNNIIDKIDNLDNDFMRDEIVYDDEFFNDDRTQKNNVNEDIVEIDELEINDLSLSNLDIIEDQIISENSVEKKISTNIEDYQEIGPSNEAIAFGGEKKIENIYGVQTKNDELKCSKCGSSLVGANGYCPGCGTKI